MKTFMRVICFVLVCAALCGCTATNSSSSQSGDEKERLAKKFFTAFYTGDTNALTDCVAFSYDMEEFISDTVRENDYTYLYHAEVEVRITARWKASDSDIQRIREEYLDEKDIFIEDFEEGYLFYGEVTIRDRYGEVFTNGIRWGVIVAEIYGKWYAFPANL